MNASTRAEFTFGASQAAFYDAVLVQAIFKPWALKLFECSRPVSGDAVLDIACGTGVVAIDAAAAVGESGKVLAVDNSPGMLDVGKSKPMGAGSGAISWLEADACTMTLPYQSFDRAYLQQGLQFMPDAVGAMKLVLKALKPGGHFTCAVWTPATETSNVIIYNLGQALMDVGRAKWFDVAVKPMSWSTTTDGKGYTKLEDALISAGFTNPDVTTEDGVFEFPDVETAVAMAKVTPFGAELSSDVELWNAFSENFANRLKPYVTSDGRVVTPARSYIAHGVAPWN